jgi:putative membrane protein
MSSMSDGRAPRWLVPLVAVLLTVLAGGVVLWAMQGHQSSGPAVPLAIVNSDQPVTQGSGSDAKTIAAGRQLAASLSSPDSDDTTPLSWQLVDADDAATGLRDGTYYGVLTIPESFSVSITSTSGTDPKQAELKLVSDDAASAAVAALAQLSVNQAARTMGAQVTNNYVDAMLQNLTTINKNLTSSAKSADSLASSSHQLADSSHSLADSSDQVADGASSLASGTTSLQSGTQSLASGAAEAASGAAQVSTGSRELESAAGTLATGADRAAGGADEVSEAVSDLARLADGLAKGAGDLVTLTGRQDSVAPIEPPAPTRRGRPLWQPGLTG